jgi:hypothetical protein
MLASEVMLASKVGAYVQMTADNNDNDNKGVALFQNVSRGAGALKILSDFSKPETLISVAPRVASAAMSRDLRYTMIAKEVDDLEGVSDAFMSRNDGSGTCTLTESITTDQFGPPFNFSASLTFWADQIDTDIGVGEGWLANPATCGGRKLFATNVDYWYTVGDEGLIYTDEGDGSSSTLRYALTPNGTEWPAGGSVVVQEQIGRVFGLTLPDYRTAIFSINNGTDMNRIGLFAYSFPFGSGGKTDGGTASDASSPDAGAPADASAQD